MILPPARAHGQSAQGPRQGSSACCYTNHKVGRVVSRTASTLSLSHLIHSRCIGVCFHLLIRSCSSCLYGALQHACTAAEPLLEGSKRSGVCILHTRRTGCSISDKQKDWTCICHRVLSTAQNKPSSTRAHIPVLRVHPQKSEQHAAHAGGVLPGSNWPTKHCSSQCPASCQSRPSACAI